MTLHRGNTPSSPSRTLEGLFQLTQPPLKALDSPRALLLELQRYKDTLRCATLARVPRTSSKTIGANFNYAFVENPLVFAVLNIRGGAGPLGPPPLVLFGVC